MKKKEQKSKSKRKVEIKVQFFQYNFIVVGYLYPENKLKFTWAAMLNPHFLSYVSVKKHGILVIYQLIKVWSHHIIF